MSIFTIRPRLQEASVGGGGGGGGGDWRAAFGADGATAFKDFKEPGDLVKHVTTLSGELKTLKEKPATFDFRKELAGDDEKAQKFLGRFNDTKSLMKTVLEAQDKIHSGELKKLDLSKATAEQLKEYRTANGIPLDAKEYWNGLPDGLVIGQDDQPVFDQYGKIMHEHNVPPAVAQAFAKQYYADQEKTAAAEAAVDREDARKATETLRKEWGNDYPTNKAILDNFLEGLGADIRPLFMDATLGNGRRLFNEPAVIKFLADAARQLNPAAHLIPTGEGNMQSLEAEIKKIEGVMKSDRTAYNKDEKMQARLRDLYAARQKMQTKK